jgi:Ribbon-helix-helix protein, copG family
MTRPVQVYLDEQDLAALEGWSRQRGWNKSQAIRAAVRALTRARDTDPLLAARGIIDGLPGDLSARFDHYLEETYVAKRPRAPRPARRRSPPPVRR